jgi:ABC-type methionine transport system ATPase subunit
MAHETQRVWLTFGTETIGQPLICQMGREFQVVFNIKNASVTPTVGIIALELEGERDEIKKAVRWLENRGVQVEPVEINIIEG